MSRIEGVRLLPAGVADDDVEPAELSARASRHQVLAERLVAQVAGDRDAIAARLP